MICLVAYTVDLSTLCHFECDVETVRNMLCEIPTSKACGPDI